MKSRTDIRETLPRKKGYFKHIPFPAIKVHFMVTSPNKMPYGSQKVGFLESYFDIELTVCATNS